MAIVNLSTLIRALQYKNNGVSRRLVLIDGAIEKVKRAQRRSVAERDRLDREIREFEDLTAALEDLRRVHGVNKRSGETSSHEARTRCAVFDPVAVAGDLERRGVQLSDGHLIVDAAFPHKVTRDAMVWETPFAFPANEVAPIVVDKSLDQETPDHFDRAVAIGGYAHLGYLVQAQWMRPIPLETATALAKGRHNYGGALAPDLIGHVIDGAAAGVAGKRFWSDRREELGDRDREDQEPKEVSS